jgi:rubredoxin
MSDHPASYWYDGSDESDEEALALGYEPHFATAPDAWTCPHCGALTSRPLVHDTGLHKPPLWET